MQTARAGMRSGSKSHPACTRRDLLGRTIIHHPEFRVDARQHSRVCPLMIGPAVDQQIQSVLHKVWVGFQRLTIAHLSHASCCEIMRKASIAGWPLPTCRVACMAKLCATRSSEVCHRRLHNCHTACATSISGLVPDWCAAPQKQRTSKGSSRVIAGPVSHDHIALLNMLAGIIPGMGIRFSYGRAC